MCLVELERQFMSLLPLIHLHMSDQGVVPVNVPHAGGALVRLLLLLSMLPMNDQCVIFQMVQQILKPHSIVFIDEKS